MYYIIKESTGYSIIGRYEFRTNRFKGLVHSEHRTWYDCIYCLEGLESK